MNRIHLVPVEIPALRLANQRQQAQLTGALDGMVATNEHERRQRPESRPRQQTLSFPIEDGLFAEGTGHE